MVSLAVRRKSAAETEGAERRLQTPRHTMTLEFQMTRDGGVVCKDLLERPALIVNEINAFLGVKINRNTRLTQAVMWCNLYA